MYVRIFQVFGKWFRSYQNFVNFEEFIIQYSIYSGWHIILHDDVSYVQIQLCPFTKFMEKKISTTK